MTFLFYAFIHKILATNKKKWIVYLSEGRLEDLNPKSEFRLRSLVYDFKITI
jgi:hypothetical protein